MAAAAGVVEIAPSQPQFAVFSGFWRRSVALLVDWVILGTIGFALGLFLSDFFVRLGPWGRAVGFAIALPYFAVFNSSLYKGNTPGKKILGLRVVNGAGEAISPGRSLARSTIYLVPFFLNGALIPATQRLPVIEIAVALIVSVIASAIVYLVVFNRPTRQSLHDRVVGTYVVKSRPEGPVSAPPFWSKHWAIIGLVNVLIFAVAALLLFKVARMEEAIPIQQAVYDTGEFHSVSIGRNVTYGQQKVTSLTVSVVAKELSDPKRQVHDVARLVLRKSPTALASDVLTVNLAYGFDIGIASGWTNYFEQHSPAEWAETLQKESETPH